MATITVRAKKREWEKRWQLVTLVAAAAYTANAVGDIYYVGDYDNMVLILSVTASATAAGDTLDVKLDGSWNGTNFYNMGEFTQQAGDGAAVVEMMQFAKGLVVADPDALLVITADAGATVVRPSMCPPYLRATSEITRANGVDDAFTFSVIAYIQ